MSILLPHLGEMKDILQTHLDSLKVQIWCEDIALSCLNDPLTDPTIRANDTFRALIQAHFLDKQVIVAAIENSSRCDMLYEHTRDLVEWDFEIILSAITCGEALGVLFRNFGDDALFCFAQEARHKLHERFFALLLSLKCAALLVVGGETLPALNKKSQMLLMSRTAESIIVFKKD